MFELRSSCMLHELMVVQPNKKEADTILMPAVFLYLHLVTWALDAMRYQNARKFIKRMNQWPVTVIARNLFLDST